MNLEEMRGLVRHDLHDEAAERWTDAELARHIAHAVSDYSEHLPEEKTALAATVADSREIDISGVANRVMVASVEYPAGLIPPRFQPFSLWGNTLTLLGDDVPDGSDARVWYGCLHVLDAAGTTIPALHHNVIAAGACGYAALAWAVNAVNRINTGGTGTTADYLAWGREQLAMFRAELRRLGRRRRLRACVLFTVLQQVSRQTITM